MPKRSGKKLKPSDLNRLARLIVDDATEESRQGTPEQESLSEVFPVVQTILGAKWVCAEGLIVTCSYLRPSLILGTVHGPRPRPSILIFTSACCGCAAHC